MKLIAMALVAMLLIIGTAGVATAMPYEDGGDIYDITVPQEYFDGMIIHDGQQIYGHVGNATFDAGNVVVEASDVLLSWTPNVGVVSVGKGPSTSMRNEMLMTETVSANTISWKVNGATVGYQYTDKAIKETITINDPTPISYDYSMDSPDATMTYNDRRIVISKPTTTLSGETVRATVMTFEPPYATDANGVIYDLDYALDGSTITIMGIPEDATYPLIIDPTVKIVTTYHLQTSHMIRGPTGTMYVLDPQVSGANLAFEYSNDNGATWTRERLTTANVGDQDSSGSMVVNASGGLTILFPRFMTNGSSYDKARYVYYAGGSWSTPTNITNAPLTTAETIGESAIDANGNIWALIGNTTTYLWFFNAATQTWSIDSTAALAPSSYVNLALNSLGYPHLSLFNDSTKVFHRFKNATGWWLETVATSAGGGLYKGDIVINNTDSVYISWAGNLYGGVNASYVNAHASLRTGVNTWSAVEHITDYNDGSEGIAGAFWDTTSSTDKAGNFYTVCEPKPWSGNSTGMISYKVHYPNGTLSTQINLTGVNPAINYYTMWTMYNQYPANAGIPAMGVTGYFVNNTAAYVFNSTDYLAPSPIASLYANTTNITITGSTDASLTYYQFRVELFNTSGVNVNNTVFLGGASRGNWADIAFFDATNASLPFWIETATSNATHAYAWVNVSNVPVSPGTITVGVMWDNTLMGALPTNPYSNGNTTFKAFDDFATMPATATGYTVSGTASVSGGILSVGSSSTSYVHYNTGFAQGNDTVARVKFGASAAGWYGIESSTGTTSQQAMDQYDYQKVWPGNDSTSTQQTHNTNMQSQYNIAEIARYTGHTKFILNGSLIRDETAIVSTASRNFVAFGYNQTILVDWWFTRNYTLNEPAMSGAPPDPSFQFNLSSYTVAENGGTLTANVTKTGTTTNAYYVNYTTMAGTAIAGTNYTTTSDQLVFLGADTSKTFTISITNNAIYDVNKVFYVNLTITNATFGAQRNVSVTITEDDPVPYPIADFTANTTSGNIPFAVQFTDLTTNNTNAWQWDFGDVAFGTANATTKNPAHLYTVVGTYTVTLTATNSYGSSVKQRVAYVAASYVPPSFIITMYAGQNLISIPLVNATGYKASDIIATGVDMVIGYNGGGFQTYIKSAPLHTDFSIEPDNGYVVYTTVQHAFTAYGETPSGRTRVLTAGQNIIGWSRMTSSQASSLLTSMPQNNMIAIDYATNVGSFRAYIKGVSAAAFDYPITPGRGYVITTNEYTVLNYDGVP